MLTSKKRVSVNHEKFNLIVFSRYFFIIISYFCDSLAFKKNHNVKAAKCGRFFHFATKTIAINYIKARIVCTISYEKLLVYGWQSQKTHRSTFQLKREKKMLNVVNECMIFN